MNYNDNTSSHYPDVTVIIPSYNSHKTIDWTIKGIKEQTKFDFIREIIVVDSSDDGITPDYLKAHADDLVKIIRSGIRVMPAIQRNIGASAANSDLLCFIDSDSFPAPDWLEIIIEEYLKGCLAGGGSFRIPEFQHDKPIAYAQYFLNLSEFIGYGKKRQLNVIPSCNFFCDKELFNKVGGFPEIRASEDSFLSYKINQHINTLYLPKAIVYHIFRENKEHFLEGEKLLGKYIYIYRCYRHNYFYYKGLFLYLFVPAVLVIKLTLIFFRVLRTNRNNVINFFKAIPLILQGLTNWGKGFMEGGKSYEKEIDAVNMKNSLGERNNDAGNQDIIKARKSFMSYMPLFINYYYADIKKYIDKLKNYKRLKKEFQDKMLYKLNLDSPRSYNEKVIWKKLYDRNPLLTITADKYAVRSYLKNVLGENQANEILIPVYYVTDKPENIPFEDLPQKFVIKPNHGSQMHLIVENKKEISAGQIVNECRKWLKVHYGIYNYEWAYRNITRKIIVEKLLKTINGELPLDYKFFCFHGKCKLIRAQINRFDEEVVSGYYNREWKLLPVSRPGYTNTESAIEKPLKLNEMIKIAEKISKLFDAVRIDLYNCDNKIYFGEITHYDFRGLARFEPESFDFKLGEYWNLTPGYWLKSKI